MKPSQQHYTEVNTIQEVFNTPFAALVAQRRDYLPYIHCGSTQTAQRWHYGSNPLHLCHFSSISRASRRAKLSIQRFLGCFPPVISAEVMQNLHEFCIL
jgi:hypothetical protein